MNSEEEMQKPAQPEIDPEMLTPAQRRAGLYSVFLLIVLLGFFLYLQLSDSGFFTEAFKWPEMLALYVPILLSMAAPIERFIVGRRDSGILLEAIADYALGIGSLILWIVFPFDFSHLAEALPANMQFLLGWINNTIGKIILLLQVVIGLLSGVAKTRDYVRMRRSVRST